MRCFLRLLLFCTCPPLCAGALWQMAAWVWRDFRFFFFFFLVASRRSRMAIHMSVPKPEREEAANTILQSEHLRLRL